MGAQLEVVKETPVSVLLDAHDSMGQLAGIRGMELAIEKAKKTGVGIAEVKNSNHFGIAGYYSMMAANGRPFRDRHDQYRGFGGAYLRQKTHHGHQSHCGDDAGKAALLPSGYVHQRSDGRENGGLCQEPEAAALRLVGGKRRRENLDAAEFLNIRATKSNGGLLPLGGYGEEKRRTQRIRDFSGG